MARKTVTTALTLALSLSFAASVATAAHADPPKATKARAGASTEAPGAVKESPTRAKWGWHDLYVPAWFRPEGGTFDVIVHWHGGPFLQEENLERARLNAVVVSINMGVGSGPYTDAYAHPRVFEKLLEDIQVQMDRTGRAPGARLGRVALSAWSAGFGAVGAILAHPGLDRRIDAVLLADGFHTSYLGNGQIHEKGLERYASFAQKAMRGEKLFVMTHSAIGTSGYPSTTETTGALLRMLGLSRSPAPPEAGPRGMRESSCVHQGSFHVRAYEGTDEKAHIDHVKGTYATELPYLKARWSR